MASREPNWASAESETQASHEGHRDPLSSVGLADLSFEIPA
jgi:hypothetical protein